VLGFAEEAWLDQLPICVDVEHLKYLDYNEKLREYSRILKKKHRCDLVVALNHMRVPDDINMAETNNTDVLDLIFGGHDHHHMEKLVQETGVYVVKSGTDFEHFNNFTMLTDVSEDAF
jgi:2',3'-cyclic-nucleotide 2'-phosphodiesterase (5'-nucleotidase family)